MGWNHINFYYQIGCNYNVHFLQFQRNVSYDFLQHFTTYLSSINTNVVCNSIKSHTFQKNAFKGDTFSLAQPGEWLTNVGTLPSNQRSNVVVNKTLTLLTYSMWEYSAKIHSLNSLKGVIFTCRTKMDTVGDSSVEPLCGFCWPRTTFTIHCPYQGNGG